MTFDEWYNTFTRAFYKGAFPHQRFGQAFSNEVYALSPTLGGALTTFRHDPFYSEEAYVHPDVQDFLRRNWAIVTNR